MNVKKRDVRSPFAEHLRLDRWPQPAIEDLRVALSAVERMGPQPSEGHLFAPEITGGDRLLPESAPSVIGICGHSRSGKDEAANWLQGTFAGVRRFAFSEPIIIEVNEMLAPLGHTITEQTKSLPAYRHLLAAVGSGRRFEDPLYWAGPVAERIKVLQRDHRLIVVTGARFQVHPVSGEIDHSDMEAIVNCGGQMWRIRRPDTDRQAAADHLNEAGLKRIPDSAFNRVIVNDADLATFHRRVAAALPA